MADQRSGQSEFIPIGSGVCLHVSFSSTTSKAPFASNFSYRRILHSPSGSGFFSNDEPAILRGEIPHNRGRGTDGNCPPPSLP
jgi:hypothetical protein